MGTACSAVRVDHRCSSTGYRRDDNGAGEQHRAADNRADSDPDTHIDFRRTRLVEDFEAIGCMKAEVEALIHPAMATLTAEGELAWQIVVSMRDSIVNGGLFNDL